MPVGLHHTWVERPRRWATSPIALSRRGAEVPNWCRRVARVQTKRTRSVKLVPWMSLGSFTAGSGGVRIAYPARARARRHADPGPDPMPAADAQG